MPYKDYQGLELVIQGHQLGPLGPLGSYMGLLEHYWAKRLSWPRGWTILGQNWPNRVFLVQKIWPCLILFLSTWWPNRSLGQFYFGHISQFQHRECTKVHYLLHESCFISMLLNLSKQPSSLSGLWLVLLYIILVKIMTPLGEYLGVHKELLQSNSFQGPCAAD